MTACFSSRSQIKYVRREPHKHYPGLLLAERGKRRLANPLWGLGKWQGRHAYIAREQLGWRQGTAREEGEWAWGTPREEMAWLLVRKTLLSL